MSSRTADVVIVGAGFAGAATAYQLARRGVREIVVVDQEARPGMHSSGRNAALARQVVNDAEIRSLAIEGTRFMAEPPSGFPAREYLKATGSLIAASGGEAEALRLILPALREAGVSAEWVTLATARQLVHVIDGAAFEGAVYCRQDGIIDIAALLDGFLRASGARLLLSRRVSAVETANGKVIAVMTDHDERIETPMLVDAAGAWANSIASLAGLAPLPLRPCRRHIVVTGPLDWVDPTWPYVWDVTRQVYFRPEAPGLLLSPCDETEQPPGDAVVDDAALALLAEKLDQAFPRLADLPIQRTWAGQRTLTPDGRFVIGADPRLDGFVWCAGLGGHGVTTSPAVGRLAAEAIVDGKSAAAHAPSRFVGGAK
jgi:D-arginine dehydrogenase